MAERYILHEDPCSGNCYKIRLTAALLGLRLERHFYDIRKGETRTPEFLQNISAIGSIPVLEIASDGLSRFLPESNAACCYLADGSALIPADRFERAEMLRWMFFEQNSHEPNVASLRFWLSFIGEANLSSHQRANVPAKRIAGEDALARMDAHLATHAFFAGAALSLADIALYAYTHVSEAGSFRLRDYAHICAWLDRVAAHPGYVPMD